MDYWINFLAYADNITDPFMIEWIAPDGLRMFFDNYYFYVEIMLIMQLFLDVILLSLLFYVFLKSPQFHYHMISLVSFMDFFVESIFALEINDAEFIVLLIVGVKLSLDDKG